MMSNSDYIVSTFITVIWHSVNLKPVQTAYSPEMETKIRNETVLNSSYDPVSRPDAQTHVKVGLSIIAIDELDLKGQKLTMAGWLTFEWEDHRIHWNKTEKDDMEYIFAKPKNIWKPELIVDNAIEDLGLIKNDDLVLRATSTGQVEWEPPILLGTHCKVKFETRMICFLQPFQNGHQSQKILQDLEIISSDVLLLRLKYDGTVDWEPPMLFVTHCEVDITYYPYDHQKCAVEIVSWTYTIEEVKLESLFTVINLEDFEVHGEWDLTETRLEDKNLTEHLPDGTVRTYPKMDFWVYLRRRTQFYNLNVMMPIILTSLMVVLVFIVPTNSGEKVSYVLTVFLSLAVLLTIVTDSLPPTSITLSVLGLYLGIVLIFSAIGILLTILILILFHKEGRPKEGSFVITIACCAARVIRWRIPGLQPKSKHNHVHNKVSPMTDTTTLETRSVVSSDFEDDVNDLKEDLDIGTCSIAPNDVHFGVSWKEIAEILDRFCFFSFAIITIFMNFAFVLTLAYGGQYNGYE